MSRWKRFLEPRVRPLTHALMRQARGLTLGVRGLVTDDQGRILLVEHTYIHGWHLPGGGVEKRETAEMALERELVEEAGVRLTAPARLLSVHSNERHHPGDHVLIYHCPTWEPCRPTSRGEIRRRDWFAPDGLPDGASAGTRRRIAEVLDGRRPDLFW